MMPLADDPTRPPDAPSPAEIRERCAAIQDGWSEATRESRRRSAPGGGRAAPRDPWTPPTITTADLALPVGWRDAE